MVPHLTALSLRLRVGIPGLGVRRLLAQLSEKRVTIAVRRVLREKLGEGNVEVACRAEWDSVCQRWWGSGYYEGASFRWFISSF